MSLGRLLAAGKSLVGTNDGGGRYRVNKRVALPRFISPHNPFAAPALGVSAADAAAPASVAPPKSVIATAKADPEAPEKGLNSASVTVRAVRWIGEWGRKVNPLPRLAKRPGPVRSLASPSVRMPLQPELSLDKVQVLRNDLSDADYEIVPRKVAADSRTSSLVAQEKMTPAGGMWDRLTTRIFGAGQM